MKQDFLAISFSLPSLSMVEYSSGYLSFISYWKTIVVYKSNKNREKLDHCKKEEMVLWEDMSLLAMKSLYEEKGNGGYPWSEAYTLNVVCYEDNYFLKRKFKLFNSLYHSVYLVFATRSFSIANMFAVRYLWTTYVTKNRDKWQRAECLYKKKRAKRTRSSRQSHCVVTAKLHVWHGTYETFAGTLLLANRCRIDFNEKN